jgi:hypothetical protein
MEQHKQLLGLQGVIQIKLTQIIAKYVPALDTIIIIYKTNSYARHTLGINRIRSLWAAQIDLV